ncbi:double-strand break repair protein AddB [Altererythrobacter sp. CC-YST694]|uniref:double-strand break repair protein AddB n=1 Tax=Altererythrobacter sp. CC-YST694 TaxID=2755038 RepID=UPI001D01DB5D|nr:double-strand break repair protein AddB [Altererythrobacter sp. CC-YST694]MCB5424667.1 double-strand break repair protein AddB [Altererythrobacter sp. CC-YST694]
MAERSGPQVYSIAAHRGFADALVAGLVPRYSEEDFGLARLTLLLPSRRAIRTVTEAFIRHYGTQEGQSGLLMPRMAVVGDLDLDETLGPLFDPIGETGDIPPAADPTRRWLRLAELVREHGGEQARKGATALRLAAQIAQAMDRLLVEDVAPERLWSDEVLNVLADLSHHWSANTRLFATVQQYWLAELAERGEVDAATRRNMLFNAAARKWRAAPPASPIVVAGVTSSAPALARLLKVISELPQGGVILPDLDLSMDNAVWDELGCAGAPKEGGGPVFARGDAVTHPQYHLKLLLNRMGVAREEVQQWHRAGMAKGPPERTHAISSLFLPPQASKQWATMPAEQRRLAGVRIMNTANPEEEAQAIALLIRQSLEESEKRVALVTPDRSLAGRVAAHLQRWNIAADDTAGRPLSQTAAGRVLLLLGEIMADHAAPVPLMALLGHPLAGAGEGRPDWLERARALERDMRGPRPEPGLAVPRRLAMKLAERDPGILPWWEHIEAALVPLLELGGRDEAPLADLLDALASAGEALCGEALWAREDGRALASLVEDLRLHARDVGTLLAPQDLHAVLRERMDAIAVRPPWGGHSRVAIYGLLEARMTRAELVICGGLNEGSWPQIPTQDSLLAPAILRILGVPAADFRIGLSAHDLAGLLGAPEVVLSRADRDISGPAIPSRFLLRVEALLGEKLLGDHREAEAVRLARAIDAAPRAPQYLRPQPMPSAERRKVPISVTALDRLRGDPYQFYANAILKLRSLDALDTVPTAAWRGDAAHKILEAWHLEGGELAPIAERVLEQINAHPLMRTLWRPRLMAALQWIESELTERLPERKVAAVEAWGEMEVRGVTLRGRADRIDRLPGGELAIVDYKTGSPPSGRMVEEGFALQLGVLGLMAQAGKIRDSAGEVITGEPTHFEYWSFGKNPQSETGFGKRDEPIKEGRKKTGLLREEFLERTEDYLHDALSRWILGAEPFTARLNPDLPNYGEYDQLMRLDEWMGLEDEAKGNGAKQNGAREKGT